LAWCSRATTELLMPVTAASTCSPGSTGNTTNGRLVRELRAERGTSVYGVGTQASDVLAGVLLGNTIPHAVRGFTGKRGLTPLGGEDSPPGANLAWAAMNGIAAAALLGAGGWKRIDDATAARRWPAVQAGVTVMSTFAMVYELTAGRRKRDRGNA
jgi:hypothetical protein